MPKARSQTPVDLEIRLLGPLEVLRDGEVFPLPRSKKTRGLLAYLAATERSHSRDHLCSLFWDVADDPRGALRWSLSKLRRAVDDGEIVRIQADRERVGFVSAGARVDAVDLSAAVARGVAEIPTEELERLAGLARGEFLEGFELPDFFEFQAWCIAARDRAREARCEVLAELVRRRRNDPRQALPHARARVQADTFNVAARIEMLELLISAGKLDEARRQAEIAARLFREVNAPGASEIDQAWRRLSSATAEPPVPEAVPIPAPEPPRRTATPSSDPHFVGRRKERERLRAWLDEVRADGRQRIVVVSSEPGGGKSRLAEWLVGEARGERVEILRGRAFEAESSRPFGPWVDALGVDMAQLVPETDGRSREGLFSAVAAAVAGRIDSAGSALLVIDDIQWLDSDSAELLHFVARAGRDKPLLILLLARSGELTDNEAALRAMRSIRREAKVEEIELSPLSREEIDELVGEIQPGGDREQIYQAAAGNPLYALELARAAAEGASPSTLVQLVRDRVDRLPADAAEVLRWASVLGHAADTARLLALCSLEAGQLLAALERLEQHGLFRADEAGVPDRYVFSHDVVREAVYGELSQPRRRLMHRQVARLLDEGDADSATAAEVARHAGLAGDALLGVRACVVAGRRALRVFANGEAETLALRGLDLVDQLEGPDRIASTLDLLHVQYSARTPDREQAAARLRTLAEQALDLGLTNAARLGFQMLSFLRWESASMADAHANIMQAERLSRSADPGQRASALAQAAKCLVLLEKNLNQAEAFVMEANTLGDRGGRSTSAVPFATAMIHEHRGELDQAAEAFREAQWIGREEGDRLAELCAIEHWMMLEIDRGRYEEALSLAARVAELGGRVREGAEGPCGQALLALARRFCDPGEDDSALKFALAELRLADAKFELGFVLSRLARLELERGNTDRAKDLAAEALAAAETVRRASDIALAHVLLLQCAENTGDRDAVESHLTALHDLRNRELSVGARRQVDAALNPSGTASVWASSRNSASVPS